MNSRKDLLGRLLDAFPISILKEKFELDGLKDIVIDEIVNGFNEDQIKEFIVDNFNILHQHINILEINQKIPPAIKKLMDGELLIHIPGINVSEWVYFHKAIIRYYDTNSEKSEIMEFMIPVKITNRGKIIIVHHNTFARDIKSYFEYPIYIDRMGSPENEILENIKHNYNKPMFKLDLNKGIKYLWENDFIDAVLVKNRQAKSIRQERMDENYTYKKSYPKDWEDLMKTPIQKTKFLSLNRQEISLHHFDCNPSTGYIGSSIHAETVDEIKDLLKLILRYN